MGVRRFQHHRAGRLRERLGADGARRGARARAEALGRPARHLEPTRRRSLWGERLGDFDPRGVNERLVWKVQEAHSTPTGSSASGSSCPASFDAEKIARFERAGVPSMPTASARLIRENDFTADIVMTDGLAPRRWGAASVRARASSSSGSVAHHRVGPLPWSAGLGSAVDGSARSWHEVGTDTRAFPRYARRGWRVALTHQGGDRRARGQLMRSRSRTTPGHADSGSVERTVRSRLREARERRVRLICVIDRPGHDDRRGAVLQGRPSRRGHARGPCRLRAGRRSSKPR